MDYVFIDSNIWLSLYCFTNDDLKQFEKLNTLVGTEITLVVPSHLRDELIRNRETKLRDSLKDFDIKCPKIPTFAKGYSEEYENFNNSYKDVEKQFKIWKEKIYADIDAETTPADKLITDFFQTAGIVDCDKEMVSAARDRYNRGNPPGKDKKYGDAINWECLLRTVPRGSDLYLVSADKDNRSLLSDEKINPFLHKEWHKKKNSEIHFYTTLVVFLKAKFMQIKLRDEQEKQELIFGLISSRNYATTHAIIKSLRKFSEWTSDQRELLCKALITNNQVGDIFNDTDVIWFYIDLASKVRFEELEDGYTKTFMEQVFFVKENYLETREDYDAEIMDALENNYSHT